VGAEARCHGLMFDGDGACSGGDGGGRKVAGENARKGGKNSLAINREIQNGGKK